MLHPIPYRPFLALLLLAMLATGCPTVVQPEFEDAERQLVVEGLLTEHPRQTINLRRSAFFYQSAQDPVQTATVTLSGPGLGSVPMVYDAGGNYELGFHPQSYQQYDLRIEELGEVYTASTIFPGPVQIDSVYFDIDVAGSTFGAAELFVQDTIGFANYYRIKVTRNDSTFPRPYTLFSDQGAGRVDGAYMSSLVFLGAGIRSGDTIILELQSLDEGSYRYYDQLARAISNSNTSGAPFNPDGNILGDGVLGFFGGMTKDTVWYIVP
jgi:hypothetical protein